MKKLLGLLLLLSCNRIHDEYYYSGMMDHDYVQFEVIKESVPGRFKDLPGKVREKEYVPFFNLMTITLNMQQIVKLYDIDNDLKPDYIAAFDTIMPIENLDVKTEQFIRRDWDYRLLKIEENYLNALK